MKDFFVRHQWVWLLPVAMGGILGFILVLAIGLDLTGLAPWG